MGMRSADKAAEAQTAAADDANALQWKMFQVGRRDQAPWRKTGAATMNYLAQILGIPGVAPMGATGGANALPKPKVEDFMGPATSYSMFPGGEIVGELPGTFDKAKYQNAMEEYNQSLRSGTSGGSAQPIDLTEMLRATPGYQFRFGEGVNALDRSAAAKGRLFSGAQDKALLEYGQGLGDQTYNDYINRLMQVAGLGQSTANAGAQLGANVAGQMGQNMLYAGNARGSGYINQANALTGAMNSGMNNYMLWSMMNKGGGGGGNSWGYPSTTGAYDPLNINF
jgi:hypothetical protein